MKKKTKEKVNYRHVRHNCCSNCQFLSGSSNKGDLKCSIVDDVYFRVDIMARNRLDAFLEGQRSGMLVCDAFELSPLLETEQEILACWALGGK